MAEIYTHVSVAAIDRGSFYKAAAHAVISAGRDPFAAFTVLRGFALVEMR
ncbi:MAG TPA: hypothetical protein VGI90_12910 [Steroidobacteraceae bacterium]|jgi:hypothetical protein